MITNHDENVVLIKLCFSQYWIVLMFCLQKGYRDSKENYQSLIILPVISEIFEKLFCNQITSFIDQLQTVSINVTFEKDSIPTIAFLSCWIKGRKQLTPKMLLVLFWLMSQTDCLPHGLVIAKLNAYEFSLPALNLIQTYLANKKQRTKINDSHWSWSDTLWSSPRLHLGTTLVWYIFKWSVSKC